MYFFHFVTNFEYTTNEVYIVYVLSDLSDFVGFSVLLDSTPPTTYRGGDVLVFNKQILNLNYYNTASGQFSCPVTGVYFVTLTLVKDSDQALQLGLYLEDGVAQQGLDINKKNSGITVTISRLIECRKGDVMTVKGLADGNIFGLKATTFSGMLMSTDGTCI